MKKPADRTKSARGLKAERAKKEAREGKGSIYRPKAEDRKLVEAFAAYGISQDRIADHLKIAETTLKKHFGRELRDGVTKVVAKVAESLVNKALNGNLIAGQFYLMRFGGPAWREPKQQVEHSGSVGAFDLSKLSDQQLRQYEALIRLMSTGERPSAEA